MTTGEYIPDDYDEWTVADVREYARDADGPKAYGELTLIREYEVDHANRSTALDAIDDAIERLAEDVDVPDYSDRETYSLEEIRERLDLDDEDDEAERREISGHEGYRAAKASEDDPIRLKNVTDTALARCGHTFAEGEEKLVARQPKLFLAIRRGELAYVDE